MGRVLVGILAVALLSSSSAPAAESKPASTQQQASGMQIVSAKYGAGRTWSDVTDVIREMVAEIGFVHIPASPTGITIFGKDPVPGARKSLVIKYQHEPDGEIHTFVAQDNEAIDIPAATTPPAPPPARERKAPATPAAKEPVQQAGRGVPTVESQVLSTGSFLNMVDVQFAHRLALEEIRHELATQPNLQLNTATLDFSEELTFEFTYDSMASPIEMTVDRRQQYDSNPQPEIVAERTYETNGVNAYETSRVTVETPVESRERTEINTHQDMRYVPVSTSRAARYWLVAFKVNNIKLSTVEWRYVKVAKGISPADPSIIENSVSARGFYVCRIGPGELELAMQSTQKRQVQNQNTGTRRQPVRFEAAPLPEAEEPVDRSHYGTGTRLKERIEENKQHR